MACVPLRRHLPYLIIYLQAALGSRGSGVFRHRGRSPHSAFRHETGYLRRNGRASAPRTAPCCGIGHRCASGTRNSLSRDGTILSSNGKACDLFGGLKPGLHISSATRSPQVLDAVMDCGPEKAQRMSPSAKGCPSNAIWRRRFRISKCALHAAVPAGYDGAAPSRSAPLDFIANASHEIKTPLASLLGFIETFKARLAMTMRRATVSYRSWRSRANAWRAYRQSDVAKPRGDARASEAARRRRDLRACPARLPRLGTHGF